MQHFCSNGKLLLFGEYFVLQGAAALAIPTQKGQTLAVKQQQFPVNGLSWKSYDYEGKLWFEVFFDDNLAIQHTTDDATARTLQTILFEAQRLSPGFLSQPVYTDAETRLEFPNNWGLGSSSTLIANIAQWAGVDAFELFFNSFKGSGYDIACALSDEPVLYRLENGKAVWEKMPFHPSFAGNIYFIFLEKKQNSREGIQHFQNSNRLYNKESEEISAISKKALLCPSLEEFMQLAEEHESIVANALQLPKVKDLYFNDFDGAIKSLGAWGGDFIMAMSHLPFDKIKHYFETKGFATIVPFNNMIKHNASTPA